MFICTLKFDRKKAAFAVILLALVIIGIILLVGAHHKAADEREPKPVASVKSEKNRVAYLNQYGWSVESPAMSEDTVMIPRSFSAVFESYNELQKQQGFDLSRYCGTEVTMYTYRVNNPEFGAEEVLAVLYVQNGKVIGGDVHSTSLDGFMQGIRDGSY